MTDTTTVRRALSVLTPYLIREDDSLDGLDEALKLAFTPDFADFDDDEGLGATAVGIGLTITGLLQVCEILLVSLTSLSGLSRNAAWSIIVDQFEKVTDANQS